MREIKFQFIYKGLPYSSTNNGFNWHIKEYTLDQLCEKSLADMSDVHGISTLIAKRQYTGLKDSNGVEIYDGDILEVSVSEVTRENIHGYYGHVDGKSKYITGIKVKSKWTIEMVSHATFHGYKFYGTDRRFNVKASKSVIFNVSATVIGNIYQNPELLEREK